MCVIEMQNVGVNAISFQFLHNLRRYEICRDSMTTPYLCLYRKPIWNKRHKLPCEDINTCTVDLAQCKDISSMWRQQANAWRISICMHGTILFDSHLPHGPDWQSGARAEPDHCAASLVSADQLHLKHQIFDQKYNSFIKGFNLWINGRIRSIYLVTS